MHNFFQALTPQLMLSWKTNLSKKQKYFPNSKSVLYTKIKVNRNKYKGYLSRKSLVKQRCCRRCFSLWGCLLTNFLYPLKSQSKVEAKCEPQENKERTKQIQKKQIAIYRLIVFTCFFMFSFLLVFLFLLSPFYTSCTMCNL